MLVIKRFMFSSLCTRRSSGVCAAFSTWLHYILFASNRGSVRASRFWHMAFLFCCQYTNVSFFWLLTTHGSMCACVFDVQRAILHCHKVHVCTCVYASVDIIALFSNDLSYAIGIYSKRYPRHQNDTPSKHVCRGSKSADAAIYIYI